VIAILDTSLHALIEPVLVDGGHIGHGPYSCELIGHGSDELSFSFGAGEPVLVDLFKSVEKFFLSCEHRFSLLLDLIELLNEVGGKRIVGSGLRSRHNSAPNSFQDLKSGNWQRHPFGGLETAMLRTRDGSDGKRNAENLPRVRAKNARRSSRFRQQKNLNKKLPAHTPDR
jgi:hypothetical protein